MKALLTVFLLLLFNVAIASSFTDTLTAAEKSALTTAYRNSCFGQLMLVDSCTKARDSIAAGKHLIKVNPYYLIFDGQTPATIDTFLANNYLLQLKIRKRYSDSFTKVYNKSKTDAFITFQKMFNEDQEVRISHDIQDSGTINSEYNKSMQFTDSTHFAYLLRYVHSYGWPGIENGSFYASIIALHDHLHHKFYLPYIKKAVLNGSADLAVLRLFNFYLAQNFKTDDIRYILARHKYIRFNVTPILKSDVPSSIDEILKEVRSFCPIREYWHIELGKDAKLDESKNINFTYYTKLCRKAICSMQTEIYNSNCHYHTFNKSISISEGLFTIQTNLTNEDTSRMFLYLTYGDDIKYNDLEILFADSSFATHAIYFENNKAEIQAESYVFLNELVQWLKSKPGIKIEIMGHTDNVGKPQDNIKLSQERAYSVRNYLMAEGIDASRLTAKGYGATKPLEQNYTDEGKAINRRVELKKVE